MANSSTHLYEDIDYMGNIQIPGRSFVNDYLVILTAEKVGSMQKYIGYLVALTSLSFLMISCEKSPANTVVGTYHGAYTRDSVSVGACTTTVVTVNPLTANFAIDFEHDPDISTTDVALEGGDEPYSLVYTGIEGTLSGIATKTDMSWILMSSTDTVSFTGTKD
jgi:hypothetical protein